MFGAEAFEDIAAHPLRLRRDRHGEGVTLVIRGNERIDRPAAYVLP
jgi:hypothetical protein